MAWRSPKKIVKEYKLGQRRAVYRHAHAFGLMERRYVDLRAALGRIIEKAGEVPVTAWAVVAAVRACAKINARGQWMERGESSGMRELLDGMNRKELLAYAQEGTIPDWFKGTGVMEDDPSAGFAALRAGVGNESHENNDPRPEESADA